MESIKLSCVLVFVTITATVFCQTAQSPKIYQCPKSSGDILVDGMPLEPAWAAAPWTDDFVDIEGEAKPAPQFRTRIKMLWDEQALYIFAEMEEPHVWATLTERDQIIFHDNDFEVFIDPDGDNHNYFEIEVNALATEFDLFMNRPYNTGGRALIGWDIKGLETGVFVDGTLNDPEDQDKKWCVEMAIPWKSLIVFCPNQKKPQQGDVWRMNFSRVQWKTTATNGSYKKDLDPATGKPLPEDNWVWSPQGAINMHLPEKWGYVVFVENFTNKPVNVSSVDPIFEEKLVLLNLYHQQNNFYTQSGRFAESLFELNKTGRTGGYNIFIESTRKQFLISLSLNDERTLFIDHQKRIWAE
jgi:hypothetical protein